MPVDDHPTHPSTQIGAGHVYGCHSKPRPVQGAEVVGSRAFGAQRWLFQNSTECRYDLAASDPACTDCPHRVADFTSVM